MKNIIWILILLASVQQLNAQKHTRANNSRSDTLDITHTIINITNLDKNQKQLQANTEVFITSKMPNVSFIDLDLEGFMIDSVLVNNTLALYNYTSPVVHVQLPSVLQINDSAKVQVYYHGQPLQDPIWGGMYFAPPYIFNMGAGFGAIPHTVGRYWFACFDNFIEKSTFDFNITTDSIDMAVCGGVWQNTTTLANGKKIWHWHLDKKIPSYLAGMAVAPYTLVHQNLPANIGSMPADIACLPADTNKVKASFAHLPQSFAMLEKHFGSYAFPRVGYSLVPFNAGAMEHACNINIGTPFIDGSLNYETLIAHELSHHWFGDNVTCLTYKDMWLNEGMASYAELLHTEYVYGTDAYYTAYKNLHFNNLKNLHFTHPNLAINNPEVTDVYNGLTYDKPSDMIHNLRTFMGDSLFFNGIKFYLQAKAYQNASTDDFANLLTQYSGLDVNNFINDYIQQPGYAHYSIDSTTFVPNGNMWQAKVYMRQRKRLNNHYYANVNMPITFFFDDFSSQTFTYKLDGPCGIASFVLPNKPSFATLDNIEALSDATTLENKIYTSPSNYQYKQCGITAYIQQVVSGSQTLVQAQQHWVSADRFTNPLPNIYLHNSKYWTINGINLPNTKGLLKFEYSRYNANGVKDTSWLNGAENSIKLYYRANAGQDWQAQNDSLVMGNATDGIGYIFAKEIKPGDYALGITKNNFADTIATELPPIPCATPNNVSPVSKKQSSFKIFPNPGKNNFILEANQNNYQSYVAKIFGTNGQLIQKIALDANPKNQWEVQLHLPNGQYHVALFGNLQKLETLPFVINN